MKVVFIPDYKYETSVSISLYYPSQSKHTFGITSHTIQVVFF